LSIGAPALYTVSIRMPRADTSQTSNFSLPRIEKASCSSIEWSQKENSRRLEPAGRRVWREPEEGEMTGTTRKSGRWSRTTTTAHLELIALMLAGLVILVLAERV
jgi:hypothetical protein